MSVSAEEVLRLARLAELAVDPADLPELTAQMDRIVSFVAQLSALPDPAARPPGPGAPEPPPLRADRVEPSILGLGPEAFAPEFEAGFFVVPRLGAMDPQ